jgi:prepilin-type N-terminal cleavage/methylation domain-containing protein
MGSKRGFTLIELLIVISLMTFLASFVYVSFPRAHEKARSVSMVQDLQTINNAFKQLKASENKDVWWPEDYWTGHDNPSINDIEELKNFIPVEIKPSIDGASYVYDNDHDIIGENYCAGVNIIIYNCGNFGRKYFEMIDEMIDDSDGPDDGRIRAVPGYSSICFNIAEKED